MCVGAGDALSAGARSALADMRGPGGPPGLGGGQTRTPCRRCHFCMRVCIVLEASGQFIHACTNYDDNRFSGWKAQFGIVSFDVLILMIPVWVSHWIVVFSIWQMETKSFNVCMSGCCSQQVLCVVILYANSVCLSIRFCI